MDFLEGLRAVVNNRLEEQGLGEASDLLVKLIAEELLTWKRISSHVPNKANAIIALSFGLSRDTNGKLTPGDINKELAVKVKKFYSDKSRPIWAQWEVFESLDETTKQAAIPIYPPLDSNGNVKYLNTEGVFDAILESRGPDFVNLMSPVLLVAHYNHIVRAARLAEKSFGLDNVITVQEEMPRGHDPNSIQPWTTRLDKNIAGEIMSRVQRFMAKIVFEKG